MLECSDDFIKTGLLVKDIYREIDVQSLKVYFTCLEEFHALVPLELDFLGLPILYDNHPPMMTLPVKKINLIPYLIPGTGTVRFGCDEELNVLALNLEITESLNMFHAFHVQLVRVGIYAGSIWSIKNLPTLKIFPTVHKDLFSVPINANVYYKNHVNFRIYDRSVPQPMEDFLIELQSYELYEVGLLHMGYHELSNSLVIRFPEEL